MLARLEDKTIEILEFALDIVQKYDTEYKKNREELEKHGKASGKKPSFCLRFEYIKDDFIVITKRNISKGYDLIKETRLLKQAEEYIEFVNHQLVIPLKENMYFVYDLTTYNVSIIWKKISDSQIIAFLADKCKQAKVTICNGWTKIQLCFDSKLGIRELYRQTIEYMKNDLEKHRKEKEQHAKRKRLV